MSREVFMATLELAEARGDMITLGGGEPTVLPQFFEYLDKAIEFCNRGRIEGSICIITNGKLAGKARKLLDYVERELPVAVELSVDEYHDEIKEDVMAAFVSHQKQRDRRSWGYSGDRRSPSSAGTRTVRGIIPVGRAAEPARGIKTSQDRFCACDEILVDPLGNVFSCGCKTHLLGNVFEDHSVFEDYDCEFAHTGGGLPVREHARILPQAKLAA